MYIYNMYIYKICYFQVTLQKDNIREIAASAFCYWKRLNREEKLLSVPVYSVRLSERGQKTPRITFDLTEYFIHHTDYFSSLRP